METMQIHSRVGADGVLNLALPLGMEEADSDVLITIEPVVRQPAGETCGGFLSQTFGSGERKEPVGARLD